MEAVVEMGHMSTLVVVQVGKGCRFIDNEGRRLGFGGSWLRLEGGGAGTGD